MFEKIPVKTTMETTCVIKTNVRVSPLANIMAPGAQLDGMFSWLALSFDRLAALIMYASFAGYLSTASLTAL